MKSSVYLSEFVKICHIKRINHLLDFLWKVWKVIYIVWSSHFRLFFGARFQIMSSFQLKYAMGSGHTWAWGWGWGGGGEGGLLTPPPFFPRFFRASEASKIEQNRAPSAHKNLCAHF
jgi:hypothetical protein